VVYGFIDPDINEVNGPVEWKFELRENDDFEVLGVFDGFGHGETIYTPTYEIGPYHPRKFQVKVPVLNSIATENLFEVWVGTTEKYGPFVGDQWIQSSALTFSPTDAQPEEEFQAEGTRWGDAFNPANR
jgi:hypothetical protein